MKVPWWGAVAVLAVVLYIAFSPGIANPDTMDIIIQGISGKMNTWHSPAASLFAGLTAPALGMPDGFLVVQAALAAVCVTYLGWLAWRAMSRHCLVLSVAIAAITAYTILLLVIASSQSIKDMWIVLLLASAGLLLYRNESPAAAIAATCLCAAAVLVRPVSIFPAAPLVAVAMLSLTRGFAGAAGATLVALLSIACLPSIFSAATSATRTSPASPLYLYDIVGIAVQTPDPPGFIHDRLGGGAFTDQQLQDCYNSRTVEPFIWGDCRKILKKVPEARTWQQAISQHPIAYLRHRLAYYPELLARIDVQMDGFVDRPMFLEASSNSPKWIGHHSLPPDVKISLTSAGKNPILKALIDAQTFPLERAWLSLRLDRLIVCGDRLGVDLGLFSKASVPCRHRHIPVVGREHGLLHAFQFARRGTIPVLVACWRCPRHGSCVAEPGPKQNRHCRRPGSATRLAPDLLLSPSCAVSRSAAERIANAFLRT